MDLSLIVPAATLPLSLEEAKQQARVEVDADDDLITRLIGTATEYAEAYTERAIMPQVWEALYDCFPSRSIIEVPRPPLISVDSITYLDSSGAEQTLSSAFYRVQVPRGPYAAKGKVILQPGRSWPAALRGPGAVRVRFTAGYSDEYESAGIPETLKSALAIYVAELYENRESTVLTGAVMQEVPFSVKTLLWPFVVDKFGVAV